MKTKKRRTKASPMPNYTNTRKTRKKVLLKFIKTGEENFGSKGKKYRK